MGIESRLVVVRGWRRWERIGVTAHGYRVSFWGVENILELEVMVCHTFKGSIIW